MGYLLVGDWRYGAFVGLAMGMAFSAVITVLGFTPRLLTNCRRFSPGLRQESAMPDDSSPGIAIGLDYLSLNRRSSTLSGGESQRIRLSSQIELAQGL